MNTKTKQGGLGALTAVILFAGILIGGRLKKGKW